MKSIKIDETGIDNALELAQHTLCELLDRELYQPMKKELKKCDETHSLGQRKEQFKISMESVFDDLKIALLLEANKITEVKTNEQQPAAP